VIAAIVARWGAPREVTIEANPTDCTPARLDAWRAAGIDRISIGIQSLAPAELVVLGRDHRFGDGLDALARAVAHGGFRVSVDFILGTPGGDGDLGWIERITATGVDHVSVYELTIEDRTAFGKRVRDGRLVPLDEGVLATLYEAAHARLERAGFEHYEISSYARPGRRAIHNSRYWAGAPYLGVGVGAASLEVIADGAAIRATNPRRWVDYAAGVPPEVSHIPADEMATDRLWLGMRTRDGVPEGALPLDLAVALVAGGLAERRDGRICPTLRGFLMADTIAAQIVQAR
jgi:oxygen-independent coproporphyrinogen-3 oxidase